MRTVGMGVKKEDPDAKLRAELEEQIELNADLMAENAKLRAELEKLKKFGEEKAEQTGRKKSQ